MTYIETPGVVHRGFPYAPLCEYQGIYAMNDANMASLYVQGFTF